ncbi:MAG: DUF5362 domain-containing protein [Chlorobiales bacterium]|nr:DUF5362 domain-containing protein [Chlorobiales bacterium]
MSTSGSSFEAGVSGPSGLGQLIPKMASDMKFIGIFLIVAGVLSCLTIIGAVVGVPTLISGLRLRESADAFTIYLDRNDFSSLERAIERQSRYFFIQKVLLIISILIIVAEFVLFFLFFLAGFNEMGPHILTQSLRYLTDLIV